MSRTISVSPGCGFAVKFCPLDSSLIGVGTGINFGFRGNGYLWLIKKIRGHLTPLNCHVWRDVVLDLDWSRSDVSKLATVSGDGSLTIWNVDSESYSLKIVSSRTEHLLEATSVVWNGNLLFTSSWDGTVKWESNTFVSLGTLQCNEGHRVNDVSVSKFNNEMVVSSSSSGELKLWDIRSRKLEMSFYHNSEIMTTTFSNFDPFLLIYGSAEGKLTVLDIRNFKTPLLSFCPHTHPVKKIVNSNHNPGFIWSASYDFSVKCSDILRQGTCLKAVNHHTEFVTGIDLDREVGESFVDCSWDKTVKMGSLDQFNNFDVLKNKNE